MRRLEHVHRACGVWRLVTLKVKARQGILQSCRVSSIVWHVQLRTGYDLEASVRDIKEELR
jgi:hypothetical protein